MDLGPAWVDGEGTAGDAQQVALGVEDEPPLLGAHSMAPVIVVIQRRSPWRRPMVKDPSSFAASA